MNDEIKAKFDEIDSPTKGFPARILDKYEPLSCLKYSENRRVYLFREISSEKR